MAGDAAKAEEVRERGTPAPRRRPAPPPEDSLPRRRGSGHPRLDPWPHRGARGSAASSGGAGGDSPPPPRGAAARPPGPSVRRASGSQRSAIGPPISMAASPNRAAPGSRSTVGIGVSSVRRSAGAGPSLRAGPSHQPIADLAGHRPPRGGGRTRAEAQRSFSTTAAGRSPRVAASRRSRPAGAGAAPVRLTVQRPPARDREASPARFPTPDPARPAAAGGSERRAHRSRKVQLGPLPVLPGGRLVPAVEALRHAGCHVRGSAS